MHVAIGRIRKFKKFSSLNLAFTLTWKMLRSKSQVRSYQTHYKCFKNSLTSIFWLIWIAGKLSIPTWSALIRWIKFPFCLQACRSVFPQQLGAFRMEKALIQLQYHCKYDLHPTTLQPDLRDGWQGGRDGPSTHILRTYL